MEKKKGTINQFNIVGVIIQFVMTIVVIIFGILTLFNKNHYPSLELAIAIDLFIMGYNNQRIYQKKNLTLAYFGFGLLLLISFFLTKLGVM